MEIETHKLKKQNSKIEIFRKKNNPNEIFSFAIQLIYILSFFVIILFGGIILFQTDEHSIKTVLLMLLMLFISWMLFEEIRDLIIDIRRSSKAILIIEKSKIQTINEQGKYCQTDIENIRDVKGKIYTKTVGTENREQIYFSEISLTLKNGNHLFIDVINSSKLFRPLASDSIKEIRKKSKVLGSLIAGELNVQFFLENKINIEANNT